jgi:hypothetical protein
VHAYGFCQRALPECTAGPESAVSVHLRTCLADIVLDDDCRPGKAEGRTRCYVRAHDIPDLPCVRKVIAAQSCAQLFRAHANVSVVFFQAASSGHVTYLKIVPSYAQLARQDSEARYAQPIRALSEA